MEVITFLSQDLGVGSTTTVLNIGAGLLRHKKKVLLIDCDPKARLTRAMGLQSDRLEYSLDDLLSVYEVPAEGKNDKRSKIISADSVIIDRNGMSLIPGSQKLAETEYKLSRIPGSENHIKEVLNELDHYDYVLIDCSHVLSFLTVNSIAASNDIYVPVFADFTSMKKITQLIEFINKTNDQYDINKEITGIIFTRQKSLKKLEKEKLQKIKVLLKDTLFETVIYENKDLPEAFELGQTIFDYSPRSSATEDYYHLSHEILKRKNQVDDD